MKKQSLLYGNSEQKVTSIMRKCKVKNHNGIFYFHQWGLEICTETETNFTIGVLEDENGEVWTCEPIDITFIEPLGKE